MNKTISFNITENMSGIFENDSLQYVYEEENYKVTCSLLGCWSGGYNASIEIMNTSESVLENWYLQFEMQDKISNIWNAEVVGFTDDVYLVKNAGWNADIAIGQSVAFGFTIDSDFKGFPISYSLIGSRRLVNEDCYEVKYLINQVWEGGFTGEIQINNNTEYVFEDWILEFDCVNEFTNVWNGEIVSHEGNHYVIRNAYYNHNISAGQSVSLGFVVSDGDLSGGISNAILYSFSVDDLEVKEDTVQNGTFVKEVEEEDVVYCDDEGTYYVNNQIVLCAYLGTQKSIIEVLASQVEAELVGYIEFANVYQLEFTRNMTYDELQKVVSYVSGLSYVSSVSLNYIDFAQTQYYPNDSLYNDNCTYRYDEKNNEVIDKNAPDVWSIVKAEGDNWGLEALNVPSAWDYRDRFQGVTKVGIYDDVFDKKHKDVKFKKVFHNALFERSSHGTHVAGIIAATFDNKIGVSGVATNAELYGYSVEGVIRAITTELDIFETLIKNNVRVINVSYGHSDEIVFAATQGNEKAVKMITSKAEVVGAGLKNLILAGYDFLIVQAAGNGNNNKYVEDAKAKYGFSQIDDEEKYAGKQIYVGGNLAYYTFYLAAIEDEIVKNRIIVVGATENQVVNGKNKYVTTVFSNRGKRVDIYAPGKAILSTAYSKEAGKDYALKDGTSMAAPYITGLAALLWEANPLLSALQVKNIIFNSRGKEVIGEGSEIFYMPDAKKCIEVAVNAPGGIRLYEEEIPQGIVKGKVINRIGEAIENVNITLIRKNVGESNLENYYYSTITNSEGVYEISIPHGIYEIYISHMGMSYLPYKINDITVLPDEIRYVENVILLEYNVSVVNRPASIQGTVYDALTGMVVEGAVVRARSGWNNYNGVYSESYMQGGQVATSTRNGEFELQLPMGNYTLEVLKDGYVIGFYNLYSCVSEEGQSIILTPELNDNEYRIVLTWNGMPRDLDSHLTYYRDGEKLLHVFYRNRQGIIDDVEIATLDLDDTDGYGPETVTITINGNLIADGYFIYSVHNFSGEENLTESEAIVRVYAGNSLIQTYPVPEGKTGNVWRVFSLTRNGIVSNGIFYNSSVDSIS